MLYLLHITVAWVKHKTANPVFPNKQKISCVLGYTVRLTQSCFPCFLNKLQRQKWLQLLWAGVAVWSELARSSRCPELA